MALHLQALYRYHHTTGSEQGETDRTADVLDGKRRICGINQWDGGNPPLFHLGRTSTGHRWCFNTQLEQTQITELTRLCRTEPTIFNPTEMPQHHQAYLEIVGCEDSQPWTGPAYWQPFYLAGDRAGDLASDRAGDLANDLPWRQIGPAEAHLLSAGLADWIPDLLYRQPFVVSLQGDCAAAVCASVRINNQAHEAGVETDPSVRRRGHASTAVSAWASLVRAKGALPLYSTSWENAASQATARRTGMFQYGVDYHITLS